MTFRAINDKEEVIDSVSVSKIENPKLTQILPDGKNLKCSEGSDHVWYYNGIELSGNHSSTISIKGRGTYEVEFKDKAGCTVLSDPIEISEN
ncbi:MAG: hypothetical protein JKY54_08305 [Flavobacteriales bacterium]|nr:hypothetical protein [Flavobacteriales bacterium]